MRERWTAGQENAAHLGAKPDSIYRWITRRRTAVQELGTLRKSLRAELARSAKGELTVGDHEKAQEAAATKRNPGTSWWRRVGYGSDSVKINVEQIFKLVSPTTEIKSL